MPLYDFRCNNCAQLFEMKARPEERWLPCPDCRLPMARQFNTAVQFVVPASFRMRAGWNLPPKGDPRWENLVREGEIRPEPEPPSLRQFIEAKK